MKEIVKVVNNEAVTDSVTLADGSGNKHKNVLELIRTYQDDLEEFGGVAFETESFDTAGGTQTREIALLNEHQATLLLTYMRNSERIRTFKKNLVKAFFSMAEKLHSKTVDPIQVLNDPAAMRGLLLTYSERVLSLESKISEQTPMVEALDRISKSDGMENITNTAKAIQVRPKELFDYLSANQWIYRRPGGKGWVAYQNRIQQGVLTHKVTTVKLSDGTERMVESVLVTPKGIAKLAQIFSASKNAVDEVAA